uniref:Sp5 transcription factor n=1 Tax=Rousettus aegyptiacus TaxID=9407 RepID=A0A7J8JN93_ROUAE|nr:Sp5 transcription factor [Rousettus aegyptiacus]
MAAVAVLRNDSLQAFLQVRLGSEGTRERWEGSCLDLSWYSVHPESPGEFRSVDAARVRPTGAHTNFTPNLAVKSVAFAGGTCGSRSGSGVGVWLRTRPEFTLLGLPTDFGLERAGE